MSSCCGGASAGFGVWNPVPWNPGMGGGAGGFNWEGLSGVAGIIGGTLSNIFGKPGYQQYQQGLPPGQYYATPGGCGLFQEADFHTPGGCKTSATTLLLVGAGVVAVALAMGRR